MTVHAFLQTDITPLLKRWGIVVTAGVIAAVIGIILLFNVSAAVKTLAILVAIGLLITGIDELVQADRHRLRWPSYVLGIIWIATAIAALVWPDVTLWALAAVVGIGFIVGGLAELIFVASYRRELPMWGLSLVDGVLSVGLGVMALVWPEATVVVLAILLGLRILFRGLLTIGFGLSLRSLNQTTQRANV